jgi:hypothetical protein
MASKLQAFARVFLLTLPPPPSRLPAVGGSPVPHLPFPRPSRLSKVGGSQFLISPFLYPSCPLVVGVPPVPHFPFPATFSSSHCRPTSIHSLCLGRSTKQNMVLVCSSEPLLVYFLYGHIFLCSSNCFLFCLTFLV